MSRSPPPPNPSIVNAGNLLPSVNVLFDEVLQRERAASQSSSGSRPQSAWSGFPGPDRGLGGHAAHSSAPSLPRPAPERRQVTERRYIAHSESPPEAQAPIGGPLPVIPNRMGGRAEVIEMRTHQRRRLGGLLLLLEAAGNPMCPQCVHDLKIESRRQVAGTHGPAFSTFAHGLKPQHPTLLPQIPGLITIPFTPKPMHNQTVLYGVSLTEILDFRDVLEDPRERVLDNSMSRIMLTIEHPGYPRITKQISGNCPHRPVSRFNLAFSVAEAYFSYFKSNLYNSALVPPNTPVVRSVTQLRLVNLYTTDRTNYKAHLAYVF
ncbi:hypothetical protein C8R47DRAFT_1227631 [Mycena vitilis]|nr:hypothetical protein C8R47DRAFT_1227631 [Mycena vitilis]